MYLFLATPLKMYVKRDFSYMMYCNQSIAIEFAKFLIDSGDMRWLVKGLTPTQNTPKILHQYQFDSISIFLNNLCNF